MNNYCINCNRYGHINKSCSDPIISCGIICINIKQLPLQKLENFLYNKFIDISDFNYKNLIYLNKLHKYKNDIKFILIQRKHSLSYIEFIRGRYDEYDIVNLKYLFSLMSKEEVNLIKTNDFDYIWEDLWDKTAYNKIYMKELNISKTKFNYCKNNKLFDDLYTSYDTPEWGFPKGRRNKFEKNLDCAIREFEEETNYTDYKLLNRINYIEEIFNGTNKLKYKHIYYLAGSDNNISLDTHINDTYEIGNIGWYTYDETIKLLRLYDTSKIDIVNQIYFFLISVIEKQLIENKKVINDINI